MSSASLRDLGCVYPCLPPLGLGRPRNRLAQGAGRGGGRDPWVLGESEKSSSVGQPRCSHPRSVSCADEEAGAALGQAMGAAVGTAPNCRHLLGVTSTAAKRHHDVSPVTVERRQDASVRSPAPAWCDQRASPGRMRPMPGCAEGLGGLRGAPPRCGSASWMPGRGASGAGWVLLPILFSILWVPGCPQTQPRPPTQQGQLGNHVPTGLE